MRILEINKYNYPKGGADRHFLDVSALLEFQGNQVAIFSMENSKNEYSVWSKYFVSYVGYNKNDSSLFQKIIGIGRIFYSFKAKRKIRKLLNYFQPEVVHIHNIYHQISFSIISEIKKKGIPIIMTVHDYHLISPDKDEFYEKIGKKYWKFLLFKKYSFKKRLLLVLKSYWENYLDWKNEIDLFISPSQFVSEKLQKWGIAKERIVVLPHFISEAFLEIAKKKEPDNEYAFYFGRILKDKGVPELIETFKKFKGIRLFLAGEIEDDTKIISDENIKYLGKLNKEEIKEYIRNSKFCVSFSRLPETFGLTALESILLGKPFIGLNYGAFSEVIDQGKTGFICENIEEAEKKINEIISGKIIFNENEIIEIAQKKFGQEKYYEKFIKIVKKLTNSVNNATVSS